MSDLIGAALRDTDTVSVPYHGEAEARLKSSPCTVMNKSTGKEKRNWGRKSPADSAGALEERIVPPPSTSLVHCGKSESWYPRRSWVDWMWQMEVKQEGFGGQRRSPENQHVTRVPYECIIQTMDLYTSHLICGPLSVFHLKCRNTLIMSP